MRALEGHHVGDQAMQAVQFAVVVQADGGLAMPAEGVQRFGDEFLRIGVVQSALRFKTGGQLQHAVRENPARRQDAGGLLAHGRVIDQLQPQQRGEDAERAGLQRGFVGGAKRRRMDGNPGGRQIVVAHRLHAHHGEYAPHVGQFFRGAHADRAVAFDVQTLDLARACQLRGQFRLFGHRLGVHLGDQVQQGVVQRHFQLVHVGHGAGKPGADLIGIDETLTHGGLGASVNRDGPHEIMPGRGQSNEKNRPNQSVFSWTAPAGRYGRPAAPPLVRPRRRIA
ncbi:hypothetical protein D3C71_1446410 [compost metagenome]